MKRKQIFIAAIIAALLFMSAAFETAAQKQAARKKTARRPSPAASTSATDTSPAQPTTDSSPANSSPAKANRRETMTEQPAAPVPSPIDKVAVSSEKPNADALQFSYEFKQPDFVVSRILIEHDAAGRGRISFVRKGSEELLTDPLEIAPAALERITAAWTSLNFLDSTESYQDEKQFPHLGTMTLGMKGGGRERKSEFNWTHNEGAAALVKEYKGIGEQQLFIFEMTVARQYQPSEAVKLFKRLESLIDRDQLSDAAQLTPLIRDLSTDERIPLIARNHAARLLKKLEKQSK